MNPQEAGRVFVTPAAYADEDYLHEAFTVLRRESPVHWVEEADYNPFWAITRHADIAELETNVEVFRNDPRSVLLPAVADAAGRPLRTLIDMDAPDHPIYRNLTAPWFHHKMVKQMTDRMTALARHHVDRMMEFGGECDFAADIALHYPIEVLNSGRPFSTPTRGQDTTPMVTAPSSRSLRSTRPCRETPARRTGTWRTHPPRSGFEHNSGHRSLCPRRVRSLANEMADRGSAT